MPLTLYQTKKNLDWLKFKALADDKIHGTVNLKFALVRVENIVGKGEIAGYQYFSFTQNVFERLFFQGCFKS